MEDPLAGAGRALYIRLGTVPEAPSSPTDDSSWGSLFTRPAILALEDESSGDIPVRALNRACRLLLRMPAGETPGNGDYLNKVARDCGFRDEREFAGYFRKATGWDPSAWHRRFCRE